MTRVIAREGGVVVELRDRPCETNEDARQLRQLLAQAGRDHVRVVIDCSRVAWIAGPFLGVLLAAHRTMGARPGDVVMCGLNDTLRQVFAITKLDQFFTIRATPDEALKAAWPEPEPVVVDETR